MSATLTNLRELFIDPRDFPDHTFRLRMERPDALKGLRLQNLISKIRMSYDIDPDMTEAEVERAMIKVAGEDRLDEMEASFRDIAVLVCQQIRGIDAIPRIPEKAVVEESTTTVMRYLRKQVEAGAEAEDFEATEEALVAMQSLVGVFEMALEAARVLDLEQEYKPAKFPNGKTWDEMETQEKMEQVLNFPGLLIWPVIGDISEGAAPEMVGKSRALPRK